jgi:hypothetical protein
VSGGLTVRAPERGEFRPELMDPEVFYRHELTIMGRPNRAGWASATCCFHAPDKHPSLRVNLRVGNFVCWSCGTRGGDVIDFVQKRDGVDFVTAAKMLNCWESSTGSRPARVKKSVASRDLVLDFKIDGVMHQAHVRDNPRGCELYRRINHAAAERLDALHAGATEAFSGESDLQWGLLADTFEILRRQDWEEEAL